MIDRLTRFQGVVSALAVLGTGAFFLAESAGWPHRWFPAGDAVLYLAAAEGFWESGPEALSDFHLSRLYACVVAVAGWAADVSGMHTMSVLAWAQLGLWSAAVGSLTRAVGRGDRWAGWAVGLLLVTAGYPYFFVATALPVSVVLSLGALSIAQVLAARQSSLRLGLIGAVLGVAADLRPQHALVLVGLIVSSAVAVRDSNARVNVLRNAASMIGGFSLVVALVSVAFLDFGAGRPPLRSSAGLNLWIGNHPGASGRYEKLPDINNEPAAFMESMQARAADESGGALTVAEADQWWARRAFSFAVSDPREYAMVLGRKVVKLLSGAPYPTNYDVTAFEPQSRVLRYSPIRMVWTIALAIGALLVIPRSMAFVVGWFAGYLAAIMLFFVAVEHTLPLLIPASVLIANGTARIIRKDLPRRRVLMAAAAGGIALACGVSNRETWSHEATYRQIGEFYFLAGDTILGERAMRAARESR